MEWETYKNWLIDFINTDGIMDVRACDCPRCKEFRKKTEDFEQSLSKPGVSDEELAFKETYDRLVEELNKTKTHIGLIETELEDIGKGQQWT